MKKYETMLYQTILIVKLAMALYDKYILPQNGSIKQSLRMPIKSPLVN